jgi:hypothetical protein
VADTMNRRFGWAGLGVLVAVALFGPLGFSVAQVTALSQQVSALGERQGHMEQRLEAERLERAAAVARDERAAAERASASAERLGQLEAAVRALDERILEAERNVPVAPAPAVAPAPHRSVTPPPKPRSSAKAASLAVAPLPQLFAEPAQAAPQRLADRRLGL